MLCFRKPEQVIILEGIKKSLVVVKKGLFLAEFMISAAYKTTDSEAYEYHRNICLPVYAL